MCFVTVFSYLLFSVHLYLDGQFSHICFALEFSVSFSVCCSIIQHMIFGTYYTIIVFIIYIFVRFKKVLFTHRSFIRQYRYSLVIQYSLAYPRCLVSCIHYYCFYFRILFYESFVQSVKSSTISYM